MKKNRFWYHLFSHRAAIIGLLIILFFLILAAGATLWCDLLGIDPYDQSPLLRYQAPGAWIEGRGKSWLGTDELGRDVLSRLIHGGQVSMGVAIAVALSSGVIGLIVGILSAYLGGFWDSLLMRITDSFLSLPLIPILIVVSSLSVESFPLISHWAGTPWESTLKLFLILVGFSWMSVARLVRAEVLSLKEREFILAAKSMGASHFRIIVMHIVPQVLAPVLVAVTLGVGESIQFEAALSFLGLGIQQPVPSWGNMLFNAQELLFEAPSLALLPGFCILLVTISFNFLGDGLQKALNPHLHH